MEDNNIDYAIGVFGCSTDQFDFFNTVQLVSMSLRPKHYTDGKISVANPTDCSVIEFIFSVRPLREVFNHLQALALGSLNLGGELVFLLLLPGGDTPFVQLLDFLNKLQVVDVYIKGMTAAVNDCVWHVHHLPGHAELDTVNLDNLVRVPLVVERLVSVLPAHGFLNLMPVDSVDTTKFLCEVAVVVTEFPLFVGGVVAEDYLSTLTLFDGSATTLEFTGGDDLFDVGMETVDEQSCQFSLCHLLYLNFVMEVIMEFVKFLFPSHSQNAHSFY